MRHLCRAFLLAILIVYPAASHAGLAGDERLPVTVEATEISQDSVADTVTARGAVTVKRGDVELLADEVSVGRGGRQTRATGKVRISHPEGFVEGSEINLDLNEEVGTIHSAKIVSIPHRYSLSGDLIEKFADQNYRIRNGRFTTCQCDDGVASWSIAGDIIDIDVGGYGHIKNGRFEVMGVPVLWVPRLILPVNQERRSGFLRPRFGYSNRRGAQTVVPFFVAFNKSHDATVSFDLETEARVGILGDYRYVLSENASGAIGGTYFNELLRGDVQGLSVDSRIPENRWSAALTHKQHLESGWDVYADGFIISDDGFLREINTFAFDHTRDLALRTLPYTESRVGALYDWQRSQLRLEGTYYQDIDLTGIVSPNGTQGGGTNPGTDSEPKSRPDSLTLQRAPGVWYTGQTLIGDTLLADAGLSFLSYQRGRNSDGLRIDIAPSLAVPLPLGPYAFGSVRVGARHTGYQLLQVDEPGDDILRSRETLFASANVGTALVRVFPFGPFGVEQIQHTIEPVAEYLYIPSVHDNDLPFFDAVDRFNARNLVSAGVVTRFIGRFAATQGQSSAGAEVREFARLWAMQSVDFDRTIGKIDDFEEERSADHLSDLDIGGNIYPSNHFFLRFRSHIDAGDQRLSGASVGMFVQDPRDPEENRRLIARTSAGLSYRFLQENLLDEVQANALVAVTEWAALFYAARYNLVQTRFLDNHFGLRLTSTCDCWAVDIGLTDRSNPDELEARVQFTLVGLGQGSNSERTARMP